MKTKHVWAKAPARGCKNPQAALHRFTVTRLSDGAERFTDRLPGPGIRKSTDFMAWDNTLNAEWID